MNRAISSAGASDPSRLPVDARPEDARLLLIDDQAFTVRAVKALLAKDGYAAIHGTTEPQDAERLFRQMRPDIVVLDISMPVLDGFAVLDRLSACADRRFAAIFLSGIEGREIRTEAYRRGAADFVSKPIDETELRLRVRNQARIIASERALARQNERLTQAVAERTAKLEDAIGVLRDAETCLAEDLRQARASGDEKMEFFASINHELRTPLNAIVGFSEILKNQTFGPLGDAKYGEYAADIHGSAIYLQRLINDVLDMARVESPEFRLEMRAVDPAAAVRTSLIMIEDQASRAGVKLVVDVELGLPLIRTDEHRLKQIVLNLTTNAIKFTPAGGQVTVKVRRDSEQGLLILVIADTGIGMAQEDLPIAMKPFGQVRRLRSVAKLPSNDIGIGLGLPITKRLTELMGGSLEIHSQRGVGTVVTVRLPYQPVQAA
ncbi:MAG TPA: hybrid sensor histidine kinase/response regulator [Alphaproteobacteria bacterium]|nr:hybrid sensor histidine kinase/response regulator [Alphaproteobacteria bacterium]